MTLAIDFVCPCGADGVKNGKQDEDIIAHGTAIPSIHMEILRQQVPEFILLDRFLLGFRRPSHSVVQAMYLCFVHSCQ